MSERFGKYELLRKLADPYDLERRTSMGASSVWGRVSILGRVSRRVRGPPGQGTENIRQPDQRDIC